MKPCPIPLQEALIHSISFGRFEDTKIILYSRRDASGTITRPKALYANGHVLKSVPYFNDLLSGEFAESEPKDFSEPVDEGEQAENYGYYSDSDLEDDEDVVNAERAPRDATAPEEDRPYPIAHLKMRDLKKREPIHGQWGECPVKGVVIKVHDIAFITFQAFLMYLYTDQIKFAPYGSEENRRSRSAEIVYSSQDQIPRPSPKSIYRLADKYDIPHLKELALHEIRDRLEKCDTVEEAFSKFSSNYEEIRTMHVIHLASLLSRTKESSAKDICDKLDQKIDSYVHGELDHAADTVTLLWKFSRDLIPAAPVSRLTSPVDPPPDLLESPSLKIALIKSMRSGVLFNRKYWVRKSATTNILRPIYISSAIASKEEKQINSLVKLHPKGEPIGMGEESQDSDWESETEWADNDEELKQESLPVLTIGTFTSWKCLFLYLCTDVIHFAPLKSQGAQTRTHTSRALGERPLTCSPKAIYSLATALGMWALRQLVLDDIKSKITSTNVITELFSNFTSRQPNIRRMQCELLHDKFNDKTTTAKGIALIESFRGGNSAHCGGALKLALKAGFFSEVSLRCPRTDCDFHNKTISLCSTRSNLECPQNHSPSTSLECTRCGTPRTEAKHTSCVCCGKQFKRNRFRALGFS